MGKNVSVPMSLLSNVLALLCHLEGEPDMAEVKRLCALIEAEISLKLKKMESRKIFTAYKTAPPGPEREALRREYVENAQIHKSFASSHEIPYELL